MDSDLRCRIVGHSAQIVAICVNKKCQNQRGLCGLCILQETHSSDADYNKNQILSLDQFHQRLIEKSQSNEQLINDYEGSIEILRYQYKNITDSLQQMIRQEEIKRNELKDNQAKLAQFIKELYQQQISSNLLSEMLEFYYTQTSNIKDTKISNIFQDIDKLMNSYKKSRITLVKKDDNKINQSLIDSTYLTQSQTSDSTIVQKQTLNNSSYHISFKNVQGQNPKVCQELVVHKQDILVALISPNSQLIASSDTENILLLWNTIFDAQTKFVNNCHILSLCFSDDSRRLFAGDVQGYIKWFDLTDGLQPQLYELYHKLNDSAIVGIFQINQNYLLQDLSGYIYNCRYEQYRYFIIQDCNSQHPYLNHDQYLQSSRDYCLSKQIYAFTNLQTIYFYSFPNIKEIYSLNVFRDLGQIVFQENSSQLLTTFLDKSEIFIWTFNNNLQLQKKLLLDCMPLNVSFYSSMIVYQTLNSIQIICLDNKQLQKVINIPQQSVRLSPLFKFYNTKQPKDKKVHLCLRSNILIFIKE